MADRTDIDALLISALYGELTPADEARLTAHLESHPADRTALADLTRTRATVRDSRILAVQLEPPQSVSAMLLREAARRAPREREDAGWFHRFVRSFMAHPAMAAAAMLVLVVGVAGTLYVRHGSPYVAPELAERAERSVTQTASVPRASDPADSPSGAVAPAAPAVEGAVARQDQAGAGSSFGVDLADREKAADPPAPEPAKQVAANRGKADDGYALDVASDEAQGGQAALRVAKPPAVATKPTMPSKKGSSGIEVRSRELAPKDLDEDDRKLAGKPDVGRLGKERDAAVAKNEKAERAPGNAGPTGGVGGGAATPAPVTTAVAEPNQATGQAFDASVAEAPSLGSKSKAPAPAPAKTVARAQVAQPKLAPQAPLASPPPPPAAAPAAESVAEPQRELRASADKAATSDTRPEAKAVDAKVIAWAAQQHRQVVALVSADKCEAAASAAIAIYNRAPDYYATNVATDRSIKPCVAYVELERKREDRSRAVKRARATDTPAASPPARVKK